MAAHPTISLEQKRCSVRVHRGTQAPVEEGAGPWAQRLADYAILSAIVYRYPDPNDQLDPPTGWSPSPDPEDQLDDSKTSLYFEVWENASKSPCEVLVVFRGTHETKDWWTNARWLTRFVPSGWDQYDLTRQEIGKVVERARQRHAEVRVMTAGHSLGGGLAQQAAYAHPDIKHVFAFDPSPVTGFRSVAEPERTKNKVGIVIERVYEHGEILAYLRTFLKQFLPLSERDPVITEIRFNLSKGDAVTQHSMVDLAERMVRAAKDCI